MNYLSKVNRRAFVVSAAAFGGGLALGMDLPFGPAVVRDRHTVAPRPLLHWRGPCGVGTSLQFPSLAP
jgi:hypothetical protein